MTRYAPAILFSILAVAVILLALHFQRKDRR